MQKSLLFILMIMFVNTLTYTKLFSEDKIEPQPLGKGAKDNGINICMDSAHQFLFLWHWTIQDRLREVGFRVTGNMQVLNKTLVPGKLSRMRAQYGHDFDKNLHRPFVEIPNPEFNVVVTYQFGNYQDYTIEERTALKKFVEEGGGLIIFGKAPTEEIENYPLQTLAKEFGASFSTDKTNGQWKVKRYPATEHFSKIKYRDIVLQTIEVDESWIPVIKSNDGKVALAIREYGKGRIVLISDDKILVRNSNPDNIKMLLISDLVEWAAEGKEAIGGDRRVPWEYGGLGGAIYPSNKEEIAGITVFYADNQQDEVIKTIRNRTKEVKALLDRMIPSPPRSLDEFYIIPAAGAGGGWAVNVYTPKSASICANNKNTDALLSIMAHEIAHTMLGPLASDGSYNGDLSDFGIGLFSEAHAGWFQQKVVKELGIESHDHDIDDLAIIDPTLRELDLQNVPEGKVWWAWKKLWFIYKILEYQYGESFYANWFRKIHEYCIDKPKSYKLNWQETLVTLSKAVGADVFPLFAAYGTEVAPPDNWNMAPMKSLVRDALKK